ncbi:MAG TPA: hypothetical protein EYN69_01950 [Flavobacteriales bacterium]|nr:hypothetical protein [Flavobacteriales bacterium]
MYYKKVLHSLFLFLTVLFISCSDTAKITKVESSMIVFSAETTPEIDAATVELIKPYKMKLEADMSAVLALNEAAMFKSNPEGALGNFVADLTLKKTNDYCKESGIKPANLCLLNNGGLRTSLPEGEITKRRVFELMPFENELVILTLSGAKTQQLFNYLGRINGMPLSGATMSINNKKPGDVMIGGVAMDTTKQYRVVTSDYLAYGGDKMRFFKNPVNFELVHHKLRDAIIEFIIEEHAAGRKLSAKKDGRIKVVE